MCGALESCLFVVPVVSGWLCFFTCPPCFRGKYGVFAGGEAYCPPSRTCVCVVAWLYFLVSCGMSACIYRRARSKGHTEGFRRMGSLLKWTRR